MKKIRRGNSVRTIMHDAFHASEFFEVDNLDTKTLAQAENNYEKTFIKIRQHLENIQEDQLNFKSETARLHFAQQMTDLLKESRLICRD